MSYVKIALGGLAAMALLAACDNGPSAVATAPSEKRSDIVADTRPNSPGADDTDGQVDHRNDPVKLVDGKPMWSASRRYSAGEGAQRAFDRNGEAFGARSVDQFVEKAHAFVETPPKGTLTLTRANGDKLFYDPKANVFAVASRAGAPRTMFKPDEGMAYWEEQKSREARRQDGRQTAQRERRSSADDEA